MIIKRFANSFGQITAVCRQSNYIWLGYTVAGQAKLRKVSAFDPDTIYYDITLTDCTKINKLKYEIGSDSIVAAVDSVPYVMVKFVVETPLGSPTYYVRPVGLTENPVDCANFNLTFYMLIPGNISGTDATAYRFTNATTYTSAVIQKDGDVIHNASGLALDITNSKLWVVTYTDPVKVIGIHFTTLVTELIKIIG